MAKVLENISKDLLRQYSVSVPVGEVVSSPDEIDSISGTIQLPWMVKALVPLGKKGKAGLVQRADSAEEAKSIVAGLIGREVKNQKVEKVLVEQCRAIEKELFLSITYDNLLRSPVILFSAQGGVDVEELVAKHPEKLLSFEVNIIEGFHSFQARQLCFDAGLNKGETARVAPALVAIYKMFYELDARLLEINPLAISDDGSVFAAGALVNIDDDALFRHRELDGLVQYGEDRSLSNLTEGERRVLEVDRSAPNSGSAKYIDFEDGNVAVAMLGGGAGLVVMDSINRGGAKPGNYSDVGAGKALQLKLKAVLEAALSKPDIKALFIGAAVIVAVDIEETTAVIREVLEEIDFKSMNIPVVARWAGLGEERAKAQIMAIPGCHYFGSETTLEEAAEKVAELI